jgi:hypothetical protein
VGDTTLPDFKLCCRAILIKTAWYWHKSRHEDQWNRIKGLDAYPCNNSHLIFDRVQNMHWRKDSLSNKWFWEN